MRKVYYYTVDFDLNCLDRGDELIFSSKELSRFGKMPILKLLEVALQLKDCGYTIILEWNILMTEIVLREKLGLLLSIGENRLQKAFHLIRVQDAGAFFFIRQKMPSWPMHLILESGNHNLIGISKWRKLGGEQLKRVILSLEIPSISLKDYIKKLDCEVEVLGLGPILLFYTPRGLLRPYLDENKEGDEYSLLASSEESPHSGFKVLENSHGTFMFNPKDYCLLDYLNELEDMNIAAIRLDNRFVQNNQLWIKVSELFHRFSDCLVEEIKENYPYKVIRGYFHNNKSDVLFKNLKNEKNQRYDERYLGEVIDVSRKKHIAIKLRQEGISLKMGREIEYRTPDGKVKYAHIKNIRNSRLESVPEAVSGQVAFVDHTTGISIRSAVYLK